MREIAFIEQNKEKWAEFENIIKNKHQHNSDKLVEVYTCIMNDFAYSQTYYPKSKLNDYLNNIASNLYKIIYNKNKGQKKGVLDFFLKEAPKIFYERRAYLYASFAIFSFFVLIGVVSTAYDPYFPTKILGKAYVETTKDNIANGNPTAIYAGGGETENFLRFTIHNTSIAMRCFIYGVFGAIITIFVLIQNGVMLGTFQYMFYQEGVLLESMKAIWIHGSIEIFSIIISGGAGLILGCSVLFPNTYSRFESFKRGGRDGVKIMITIVPFFLLAAFLEGYITKYANYIPGFLCGALILILLTGISYYYLIYPIILNRRLND
ncbi:MAG: stage II sporulation protein M [Bacteroidales bacterium]